MDRNLGEGALSPTFSQKGTISGDRFYRVTRGKPSKLSEKIGISILEKNRLLLLKGCISGLLVTLKMVRFTENSGAKYWSVPSGSRGGR